MDTTPQDLLVVALEAGTGPPPEQGDLSLALAGAELIDLLDAGAVRLDGTRILPAGPAPATEALLAEAAATVLRQPPFESVEDWLWRRGRGLAAAYASALGTPPGTRGPRLHPHLRLHRTASRAKPGDPAPPESAGRRAAIDRWMSREPVLTALAAAAGIAARSPGEQPDITDDDLAAVLATVNDAVRELDAVRRRRAVEDAAFDNIWRGGVG
ncbi:Golgi phosphoprotein 3 GPP34 [Streptomyces sp. 1114.5]|uniref:GPP34 family phosphoprotein n=1 Tax=Streptomyces sp. 1114.5 TaxID=1938830 RepID=UPI000EB06A4F|nr:GPP34 family phosphoprotein [Streptomyces sp. 1114.5]RKT09598.1 Golgi phosphoprotein 3 GPP34 [Streptomyces sp. 1114.5]